ncbi:hypothetical protein AAFC00_000705 [Neodothiora populina]|uniref:Uncharacterized protein n=1 Tax=Neodothiora populina TaxID=2781224 RepID=A0ABR3PDT5_9PEZI
MSRNYRGAPPQMSSSWASNIDGWAEEANSVSSEESQHIDHQTYSPESETRRHRQAINDDQVRPSHASTVQNSMSGRRRSVRDGITRGGIAQTAYGESPRRRTTRSVQPAGAEFIMPCMDSLPDQGKRQRNTMSSQQFSPDRSGTTPKRTSQGKKRTNKPTPNTDYEGTNYLTMFGSHVLLPMLQYALSVLGIAAQFAKPILSYGLALWLLVGIFIMGKNFVTKSVNTALTPLCRIPGSSLLNLPFCEPFHNMPTGPVEFDKLVTAQSAIDEVLSASVGEGALPLAMKHSEASIRDLRTIVEHSKLPSRNELVFEFTGFIDTARQASKDLSRYNTRIGRGVDKILTTNKWTLQVISGVADDEAHRGSISRLMSNINIFTPFLPAQQMTQELLVEQYLRHTATIQTEIEALIIEAEALLIVLDNLDNRLQLIGDIAVRDGAKIQDNKDELLANLWTWLGGNQNSVARLNSKLQLLNDVSTYRKLATAHVAGTVVKLQAISNNLEDLRHRVGQPEAVGVLDGLPLEMHIEHIRQGVERLEQIRIQGRERESQKLRAILDREERLEIDA